MAPARLVNQRFLIRHQRLLRLLSFGRSRQRRRSDHVVHSIVVRRIPVGFRRWAAGDRSEQRPRNASALSGRDRPATTARIPSRLIQTRFRGATIPAPASIPPIKLRFGSRRNTRPRSLPRWRLRIGEPGSPRRAYFPVAHADFDRSRRRLPLRPQLRPQRHRFGNARPPRNGNGDATGSPYRDDSATATSRQLQPRPRREARPTLGNADRTDTPHRRDSNADRDRYGNFNRDCYCQRDSDDDANRDTDCDAGRNLERLGQPEFRQGEGQRDQDQKAQGQKQGQVPPAGHDRNSRSALLRHRTAARSRWPRRRRTPSP